MMTVYNRRCCAQTWSTKEVNEPIHLEEGCEVVKAAVEVGGEEGARPPLMFHGHGHGQGHSHEDGHGREIGDALEQEQKIKARGRKRVIAQVINLMAN